MWIVACRAASMAREYMFGMSLCVSVCVCVCLFVCVPVCQRLANSVSEAIYAQSKLGSSPDLNVESMGLGRSEVESEAK